jgi:RNA polymerase sigma factor (TIGR02999 family)
MSEITRILNQAEAGDPTAAADLLPLVYAELRKLAMHKMANEKPGQTLQPTALVHEAYLRLVGSKDQHWNSRGHFFVAAAEAMRRILIENARRKHAVKHGSGLERLDIDQLNVAITSNSDQVLAVNDALERLAGRDKLGAELIKLRFFTGLSHTEAAEILGIAERTAKRRWAYARAWLYEELRKSR